MAREHQPPPAPRDLKSLGPSTIIGVVAVIGILTAGLFVWTPWDSSPDDTLPSPQRQAQPTPPLAGTPNP